MASKYDVYWAARLAEIGYAVARAASGMPARVELPGLRHAGGRQSWYGVSEVNGRGMTRSSMAHATALGKTVAASGLCAPWPELIFRFTVAAAGDVMTVSAIASGEMPPGGPAVATSTAASGFSRSQRTPARPNAGDHVIAPDRQAGERFYQLLDQLTEVLHGPRLLRECRGRDGWPRHGIYFFYEPGEVRANGRHRIVRVGTHALTATSQATLWGRLRQHRGQLAGRRPGGGNHRASVFRRHVGAAIIRRDDLPRELLESWLDRRGPHPAWAADEARIEQMVSAHIGAMPFLWLAVPDRGERDYVERNSIALTSQLSAGLDPSSARWLGRHADRAEIRESGLWNVDHVHHCGDPGFLDRLDRLVEHRY